ncbi:nudix-type motif 6-like protein [Reticulomyxa filosa]|uniref:Nudix-type motif 6-like protein n=1 Tax=Reticulomyxa filosa TaxID=46433 RepID=X6N4Y9_RETFI|nr:nudix-type motif 6-like protein [Reticulomyxa filosa]|eukprot:ETO21106.1 nudix-type motif 6-like protein [Reticulomyxa filosa]
MTTLKYRVTSYNCVQVVDDRLLQRAEASWFDTILKHSLSEWEKLSKYKAVWLQIPAESAALVAVAMNQGFESHHSHPHYFMLTRSLGEYYESKDESSNKDKEHEANKSSSAKKDAQLPPAPSHFVGVAGIVFNENDEILMVQEKVDQQREEVSKEQKKKYIYIFLYLYKTKSLFF